MLDYKERKRIVVENPESLDFGVTGEIIGFFMENDREYALIETDTGLFKNVDIEDIRVIPSQRIKKEAE